MQLSVFHTPEQISADCVPDCAVVIDVLRATSTMAAALAAGAEAIEVFADLQRLLASSERWPASRRVLLGERGGTTVDGFDLGNSPVEVAASTVGGRRVFMSTTNGTRCLAAVGHVATVVTAALTTRRAVVEFLVRGGFDTVWLVASGWQGEYSLEDTVCAGAIADELLCAAGGELGRLAGNDAFVAALSLFRDWRGRLPELLCASNHGRRLLNLGRADDLAYCADIDRVDVVPIQAEPGVLTRNAWKLVGKVSG